MLIISGIKNFITYNSPWGGSGNNNDNNNQSPWGEGGGRRPKNNRNNKGDIVDLTEFLDNVKTKFDKGLPPGKFFGSSLIFIFLFFAVIWGITGIYFVEPNQQGVVLRFGKFSSFTSPGANYHFPYPIEQVRIVNVTDIREESIGLGISRQAGFTRNNFSRPVGLNNNDSLMLTGDENIVDVKFTVSWFVGNAKDFLFNVEYPEQTVRSVADSAMREVIGRSNIEDILMRGKTEIENEALTLTQKMLDDYGTGINITRVQLKSTDTPQDVIASFRGVQEARADKEKVINQSQAFMAEKINEAKGEAARMLAEAQAYKVRIVEEAKGEANRFNQVLNAYNSAKQVTRKRLYIETMEKVLNGKNKVILEHDNGVLPYLPLGGVQSKAPKNQLQNNWDTN